MKYVFVFALLTFPSLVFGAVDTGLVGCSGPDCNACSFVQMISNIIQWLVGILVIIAVLLIVRAGFELVVSQGNPAALTNAKKMMTNVAIGFVIMMAAWTIVDTVIKALVDPSAGFGVWNQISDCGTTPATSNTTQHTSTDAIQAASSNENVQGHGDSANTGAAIGTINASASVPSVGTVYIDNTPAYGETLAAGPHNGHQVQLVEVPTTTEFKVKDLVTGETYIEACGLLLPEQCGQLPSLGTITVKQ